MTTMQPAKQNEHAFFNFPDDWEKLQALANEANEERPVTLIISNGSRWAGSEPATVGDLLHALETDPLDLTFMEYGGFIDCCPVSCTDRKPLYPDGFIHFHGNFLTVSHCFSIVSNDRETIAALTSAIKGNLRKQQRNSFTA